MLNASKEDRRVEVFSRAFFPSRSKFSAEISADQFIHDFENMLKKPPLTFLVRCKMPIPVLKAGSNEIVRQLLQQSIRKLGVEKLKGENTTRANSHQKVPWVCCSERQPRVNHLDKIVSSSRDEIGKAPCGCQAEGTNSRQSSGPRCQTKRAKSRK
jgi:hypothetical protein